MKLPPHFGACLAGFQVRSDGGRFIRFEFVIKQQGKLFGDVGAIHDDAFLMNKHRDSDP